MQLPVDLRGAIDQALEGVSRNSLAERASRISEIYRAGGASSLAICDEMDALAYAVARMPATYAAVRNALSRFEERCPEFAPSRILDLGAGPGTASWAATEAWPAIESIAQIDSNNPLLNLGRRFAESSPSHALRNAHRVAADLAHEPESGQPVDLVLVSYTLAEFGPAKMNKVLISTWLRCSGAVVIVEPGTPLGYERILRARDLLIAQGARILAPCPHQLKCPLLAPDWCHFVQRVARSRDHMLLKSAEAPYEDERFSYLIAVREHLFHPAGKDRILAQPDAGKVFITAKLCKLDGASGLVTIAKRDKDGFKLAKKKSWGDQF
jgi:ribosomal protein RSM22 (predicted rRNA methylase)